MPLNKELNLLIDCVILVNQFFKGNIDKTKRWFDIKNPQLGNATPMDFVEWGRVHKLHKFISSTMDDNNADFANNIMDWAGARLREAQQEIDKLISERKEIHPQYDCDLLVKVDKKLHYLQGRGDTLSQLLKNISDLYVKKPQLTQDE
jgi:hypothetical protein